MKESPEQPKVIFIGGSGRSGTTILKTLLNEHSDATGIHEFKITIDPDGLVDFYKSMTSNWNPYLFDSKLKRLDSLLKSAAKTSFPAKVYRYFLKRTGLKNIKLKTERRNAGISISDYCPGYEEHCRQLINELKTFTYPGHAMHNHFGEKDIHFSEPLNENKLDLVFGSFYRNIAGEITSLQKVSTFVDDNTWNFIHFDVLLKWLPGSCLIHIHRHPLDVVSSFLNQSWTPDDPLQAAQLLASIMNRWFALREKLPPESYLEISLMELVQDPEDSMNRIYEFCGMPVEKKFLSVNLSRSNSGRWKQDLPENLIPQLHDILQPVFTNYGYTIHD